MSSTLVQPAPPTSDVTELLSPEEFLALPDSRGLELVDGLVLEKGLGLESGLIGGNLFRKLADYCDAHRLGVVLPMETGYQCFAATPRRVRKPDVSFIPAARFPYGQPLPTGYCKLVPELVAEVVSPGDHFSEIVDRIADFRKAGTPLAWVVDPPSQTVLVYHRKGPVAELTGGDVLSGEEVVPGFRFPLSELFRIPGLPEPPPPG